MRNDSKIANSKKGVAVARCYIVNRGQHDAMIGEKSTPPGGGRIVHDASARVAMANYPGLEIVPAEDAPVYRWCKVLAGPIPWQGGELGQGALAWFDDGSYRLHRDRLAVISTALDD